MIEFIRSVYRTFVLISFWIFLILSSVGGGVTGAQLWVFTRGDKINYTVGGVIIGFIVGFIIDINVYGFVATILNIDENVEYLCSKYYSSSGNSSSQAEVTCKKCGKTSRGYSTCPHCGAKDF